MSASTMIHVRIDEDTKAQATEALDAIGLSMADAIRLFLRRLVIEQAIPIELKAPNAETRAAMEEARAIRRARFPTPDALFDDLGAGER
jgi:DNA-damage-inducible protein J